MRLYNVFCCQMFAIYLSVQDEKKQMEFQSEWAERTCKCSKIVSPRNVCTRRKHQPLCYTRCTENVCRRQPFSSVAATELKGRATGRRIHTMPTARWKKRKKIGGCSYLPPLFKCSCSLKHSFFFC